jgi:twitching motility protein PilT
MAVMYQHVQGKAKPLRGSEPGAAAGARVDRAKAMAVDKLKRFQTMDELRIALVPLAGRLMARIDAFLKLGLAAGLLGHPPGRGRAADAAHEWRPDADQVPRPARHRARGLSAEILTKNQRKRFDEGHDLDFSYVSADKGRFRVNVFRKDTGIGATFRAFPPRCPRSRASNLPADGAQALRLSPGHDPGDRLHRHRQVDHARGDDRSAEQHAEANIISLEDPIEFVHRSKQSQVIQRELGTHMPSFADGVRAAMREDPDVILVGELRDAETIRWR